MANQKGAPKFLNCRSLLCKRALRFPDSDPFDLQVLRCSTYYLPTSTCWSRLLSKIQIILESPAAVKIFRNLFKCVDRRSQLKWPQRFPLQLDVQSTSLGNYSIICHRSPFYKSFSYLDFVLLYYVNIVIGPFQ